MGKGRRGERDQRLVDNLGFSLAKKTTVGEMVTMMMVVVVMAMTMMLVVMVMMAVVMVMVMVMIPG